MRNSNLIAMLLAAPVLAGCGTIGLFGTYDLPEGDDVATAPWPRLVDVPETPPAGTYNEVIPDPAIGISVESDLSQIAAEAGSRAAVVNRPVLTDAERARLRRP